MTGSGPGGPVPVDDRLTPRTLLFVPGDRPERFDKAAAAGADGVIIDLEDSVPAQHKEQARSATAAWLTRASAWVRVNPSGSDDFLVDLDRCAAVPGLAGIVVPKAERTQDLDRLTERVGPAGPVIALIESARGLLAAEAIAGHPSVQLIAFGNLDFAADCGLGVEGPDELELLPARTHLSVVARAAGLPGPIDGVTADVSNPTAAARCSPRRTARILRQTLRSPLTSAGRAPSVRSLRRPNHLGPTHPRRRQRRCRCRRRSHGRQTRPSPGAADPRPGLTAARAIKSGSSGLPWS
jgi:citrate lyase subunit beta/citryl-CoA lyase